MRNPSQPLAPVAPSVQSVVALDDRAKRREQVLAWIRSSPDLPTPPTVALQIIDKASQPECELDELARIVAQDPALCAKVLRTVNSVMYGLRSPVSSIPVAVRTLGVQPLRSLVLTLTLSSVQHPPLPEELLQTYWRVSVAGALAAHQLAVRTRRSNPDNDLAAGLVRDLGMLVLHTLFPHEYKSILGTSPVILSGFQCELEEDAVSTNHAEVSAELLRIWRLPPEITEPVRFHHDWDRAGQLTGEMRERARLLYMASQIGQLQLTADRPMLVREVLTLANKHFAMQEADLRAFLKSLQIHMEEFASILQVDLGSVYEYSGVISRGIEELTRLAVQASVKPPTPELRTIATPPEGRGGEDTHATTLPKRETGQVRNGATIDYRGSATGSDADLGELLNQLISEPGRPGTLGYLDGYEILDVIGRGGMGTVFRAMDVKLGRQIAIKTLLPHLTRNGEARERFLDEARAVAVLNHENIVRVYAVGESGGIPYLVMEYIKGISLGDRLLREAPLPLPEVIRIGMQTASGLSVAHAAGLVHRDIKPANLLLEESTRRVKIVDFGLAQAANQALKNQNGALVGTPHFMSPEQAETKPTDPRSDMFSLGSVLFTACTGQLPFDDEPVASLLRAICESHPPPIRTLNPAMPAWLEEIVLGLLAKEPSRRFPTAAEMKRLFLCRWANLHTSRWTSSAR